MKWGGGGGGGALPTGARCESETRFVFWNPGAQQQLAFQVNDLVNPLYSVKSRISGQETIIQIQFLKVPKCENFGLLFFTLINHICVGV